MKPRCICGCGRRSVNRHHCIYAQALRPLSPLGGKNYVDRAERSARQAELLKDPRNLVPVAWQCHQNHHAGSARFPLAVLPDSVYEFAVEVLGAGPAYEYLKAHYAGSDPRLDALLAEAA